MLTTTDYFDENNGLEFKCTQEATQDEVRDGRLKLPLRLVSRAAYDSVLCDILLSPRTVSPLKCIGSIVPKASGKPRKFSM